MTSLYLYNNELIPKDQVHISPDDRGYYFGDGVYEVFRVYSGKLYEAEAHYERLKRSAAALRINFPMPLEEMQNKITELIEANRLIEGTVYLQITRGAAARAHPFPVQAKPILLAYTSQVVRPVAMMKEGISSVTLEDIRWLRCDLKTLNLLPNVMAKQHALDQGASEVILHRNGVVTECSAANVIIVKQGVLHTHPANHLILHGITRMVALRLARKLGIEVNETPFTLEQLSQADEVFMTGTTVEITPIVSVNGSAIADRHPGAVTTMLQQAYEETIPV